MEEGRCRRTAFFKGRFAVLRRTNACAHEGVRAAGYSPAHFRVHVALEEAVAMGEILRLCERREGRQEMGLGQPEGICRSRCRRGEGCGCHWDLAFDELLRANNITIQGSTSRNVTMQKQTSLVSMINSLFATVR